MYEEIEELWKKNCSLGSTKVIKGFRGEVFLSSVAASYEVGQPLFVTVVKSGGRYLKLGNGVGCSVHVC